MVAPRWRAPSNQRRLFKSTNGCIEIASHAARRGRIYNRQAVALLCCLLSLFVIGKINAKQSPDHNHEHHGTSSEKAPSIEQNDYVNLNDILKHQQALVGECRRLEANKLLELKRALELKERQHNGQPHEPIALKLPAVCLLLTGPPSVATSLGGPPANSGAQSTEPLRLDLVNWLYDYDDLLDELQSAGQIASNKTKRQASAEGNLIPPSLDPDQLGSTNSAANAIDTEPASETLFRKQLEQMISDDRFQEAVRMDQARIGALLSPVVLVPGLAGSRLQARVSKVNRVNIICKKQHDWQEMWLSLRSFLPIAIDCWIDNVRLEFDPSTGFTRSPAGVEARAPHFGSVESVRHLDLKSPKLTKYYDAIIERYIKIGYQADKNLLAAPYDFRLAPQQIHEAFFEPLKQLIDEAAADAAAPADADGSQSQLGRGVGGGQVSHLKKVTLVCHSMGCNHLLVFLRQQSSAWRQTHIRKIVALSSPWAGATKALKALLVGEQFNLPIVSETKMRDLTRTFPSVAYLLPQAEVFARPTGEQVDFGGPALVQTPQREYRANQLEELLRDVNLELSWEWFKQSAGLVKPLEPLDDVRVDCLHGLNVPTVETILFRNQTDFPNGDYELVNGNGDGTVNHQSLLVCADWASSMPHLVRHKILPGVTHTGILSHKQVLEYLTEDAATD